MTLTAGVHAWWMFLCIAATLNIAAWTVSAALLARHRGRFSAAGYRHRLLSLWLSAGYVAGCAFRSFLPRIDLERICLVASSLSSMVAGRSVATVAELCFIAQCALLLHYTGSDAGNRFAVTVSRLMVPFIAVAEVASWYAILSTNYLGHFVENSIWTLCAVLLLASLVSLWPNGDRKRHRFLAAMMVFGIGYVAFMLGVDLPMYWSRWTAERAAGAPYLSLAQGLADASRPCIVSFGWRIWREEIPWMTLYFTFAVWLSILLPHMADWVDRPRGKHAAPASRQP
jgi:hypothetical protein